MNTLFFDTETTGLPKGHYSTDYAKFPKVVQIAWKLVNEKREVLTANNHIIRPDGWEIPAEASKIHGISTEAALEVGHDLKTVLRHFIIDCQGADKIVAHNIYFDTSIVKANLLCIGIDKTVGDEALDKDKRVDTMRQKAIIDYVGARYDNDRPGKWPKLAELYDKLFDAEIEDAHDATNDVNALEECYYKLIDLKIIN